MSISVETLALAKKYTDNVAGFGVVGPQGPEGPQGEQGPQGEPGQNGTDGANGATFIPSVSAEGVISWTNDGGLDNPNPVNIKGPKGDRGDTGATGATGATGPQGPQGETGPAGPQGEQGPIGPTGAAGQNGQDGVSATIQIGTVTTGEPGTNAVVTNVGTENAGIFNFTIPRGADGVATSSVVKTAETTVTLQLNTTTVITGVPTTLTVSFANPLSSNESEYRLIFKAGARLQPTFTAPTGYVIKWDSELTITENSVYEIDFTNLFLTDSSNNIIIGAIWKEWV